MKSYRPRGVVRRDRQAASGTGRAGPEGRAPHGRQSRTPTAACCCGICGCRISATTRSRCRSPGAVDGRGHPRAGRVPPRRDRSSIPSATSASSARTRPPRTAGAPSSRSPTAAGRRRSFPSDDHLAPDGRVMEILSEHSARAGWKGYLLTGRHGFFSCYEAFIHIIDSMFNQHAKWLKVARRDSLAPADRLAQLPAHLPRLAAGPQRLQPPGPRLHRPSWSTRRRTSSASICRPTPTRCFRVTDHCLRSRDYVNVIVAGKQPAPQWLDMDAAIKHCTAGIGIWEWASNDQGGEPDVVMACCGDVPTLETLAAVELLREHFPDLKVRVVNVVDLMTLQPQSEHPHGLSDRDFDALFTTDKPIIFAYHGYPWLIHRLTYRRTNHQNLHVRGYKEEGTTTTPFDMVVLNDLDRFHLVGDVIDRVPAPRPARGLRQAGHPRQADRPQGLHSPARPGHAGNSELEMGRRRDAEAQTRGEALTPPETRAGQTGSRSMSMPARHLAAIAAVGAAAIGFAAGEPAPTNAPRPLRIHSSDRPADGFLQSRRVRHEYDVAGGCHEPDLPLSEHGRHRRHPRRDRRGCRCAEDGLRHVVYRARGRPACDRGDGRSLCMAGTDRRRWRPHRQARDGSIYRPAPLLGQGRSDTIARTGLADDHRLGRGHRRVRIESGRAWPVSAGMSGSCTSNAIPRKRPAPSEFNSRRNGEQLELGFAIISISQST